LEVIYPLDMKSMMLALRRGGCARKVMDFCCLCGCLNTLRYLLFKINPLDNSQVQISREEAVAIFLQTGTVDGIIPKRWKIGEDIHSIHTDAMPGVTQENVVPCGLHGETRCILNFIKYQLCEINKMHDQNVKETLFKKFQDFMNRRVFGCSSRPGQYTFSIDKETKMPNMPYLQHGHCLVILDHIDEYINEIDTERPELSRIIFHNFRNAVKIMNI